MPTAMNKLLMFLMFFIGVTTIFPYFSYITRGSSDQFSFNIIDYYKSNGDFDGFQSTLNVIQYTMGNFFTLGKQLLGAVLVFVPRSIWSGKPYPTGQVAAEFVGYDFTNISSPIVAELYMDFGFIGVTLLSMMLGVVVRKIDSFSIAAKQFNNHKIIILSAIIFSFFLILLRGPLIAVIANVMLELGIAFLIVSYMTVNVEK